MPKFNVENDPVFNALAASVKAAIIAAKEARPNKLEQLMGHVFTELGITMKQQSVISYMMNGDVDADELLGVIVSRKNSAKPKGEKRKYKISNEKLKSFFQTLLKEDLIRAKRAWQIISYWLEQHCEGWTGNKGTQIKRLKGLLMGVIDFPAKAFSTHNPNELNSVLTDPEGKLGKLYYDTIKRLEELCLEDDENMMSA